ncbi:MAG: hydroxymethylbilane synthase [Bryobacteraceae bacterium]|nr:hydroxymethylbilane synthase [Bryobacteraceae bacterium]
MSELVIGTRGSALALAQARRVRERLEAHGHICRIQVIRTAGDRMPEAPLPEIGGKGLFTRELEEALLEGRIDLAVHSLKDLPVALPEGLWLAAVPEREDPRDAVVGRKLADLPPGARVGTSSARRAAQLKLLRPDLAVEAVRGNLDTRLRKLDSGRYDALILAAAGLRRLGWGDRVAECLPPEQMCPAPGQGALAVETRRHGAAAEACAALDDPAARAAVHAERGLLQVLGGGCQIPLGAYAEVYDGILRLHAVVGAPDGSRWARTTAEGNADQPDEVARRAASRLLEAGAREILDSFCRS